MAITAATVAELAAGPHLASSTREAAKRQARLQEVESTLQPLAFDAAAARSYGLIVAAVVDVGRKPRGRFADLLIAACAHANGLDLYTRNGEDFRGFGSPAPRGGHLIAFPIPKDDHDDNCSISVSRAATVMINVIDGQQLSR
jgi:predicted nucleic acid-binding protein